MVRGERRAGDGQPFLRNRFDRHQTSPTRVRLRISIALRAGLAQTFSARLMFSRAGRRWLPRARLCSLMGTWWAPNARERATMVRRQTPSAPARI